MKETKNDLILTNLKELDITKLKDVELTKTAEKISKTLNINGLIRHINHTLILVLEDKTKDDNQKFELIKTLLGNQKIVEHNIKIFKRKTSNTTDKKDIPTFINTAIETLSIIKQYQPKEDKAELNVLPQKPIEDKPKEDTKKKNK